MHKFSTAATALHSKEIWGQPTRFPTCEVGCLPFEAGKRVGCPHIEFTQSVDEGIPAGLDFELDLQTIVRAMLNL